MPFIGSSGKALVSATTSAEVVTALGLTLPATAITQTYSTAAASNPAMTAATLAGTLTGTTDGTLADVSAIALSTSDTYTDAAVNSAVNTAITSVNLQLKEIQTILNALVADVLANKKLINQIVDDLQSCGIQS